LEIFKEFIMPDASYILGNTAKGAAMGSAFGLPGTIIGGVIGGLSSLFGNSPEEERAARKKELLAQIAAYRQASLARAQQLKTGGIKDISKETATQLAMSQSDIARRMAASGRVGDTEGMLLPVTSKINEQGGNRLESAIKSYDTGINDINTQFDNAALSAESDYAARPIEPTLADQLMGIGSQYLTYKQNQDYIDAYKNKNINTPKPTDSTASPNLNASLIEQPVKSYGAPSLSPSSLRDMISPLDTTPSQNLLYQPEISQPSYTLPTVDVFGNPVRNPRRPRLPQAYNSYFQPSTEESRPLNNRY
jgi:hypothetical protein